MSRSQGLQVVSIWSVSQEKYLRVHDSTGELTPDQDKMGQDTAFILAWKDYGGPPKYIGFYSFSRQKWLQVDAQSDDRVTATAHYHSGSPTNAPGLFWLQPVGGATDLEINAAHETRSASFGIRSHFGGGEKHYAWGLDPDDDYKVYGDRNAEKIDSHNHLQFQFEYASADLIGGPLEGFNAPR